MLGLDCFPWDFSLEKTFLLFYRWHHHVKYLYKYGCIFYLNSLAFFPRGIIDNMSELVPSGNDLAPNRTNYYSNQWASYQIGKIVGAHAPGMPGTFSLSPRVSDPDMHHGTCVTHVPWCMPGSLTNGFLWNRRRGGNVPGIPGACATCNFTYLVRGPWRHSLQTHIDVASPQWIKFLKREYNQPFPNRDENTSNILTAFETISMESKLLIPFRWRSIIHVSNVNIHIGGVSWHLH